MGQTSVAVEGERANGAMSVLPRARRLCTLPVSFPVNKISLFIMMVCLRLSLVPCLFVSFHGLVIFKYLASSAQAMLLDDGGSE